MLPSPPTHVVLPCLLSLLSPFQTVSGGFDFAVLICTSIHFTPKYPFFSSQVIALFFKKISALKFLIFLSLPLKRLGWRIPLHILWQAN
jgi:hypothetical protein